jgi:hypothetical protein
MGSSGPGPTLPPHAGDSGTERVFRGREPTTQPQPGYPVQPSYQPVTNVPPREPVTQRSPSGGPPAAPVPEVVRYGPGVPDSQAGMPAAVRYGPGVPDSQAGMSAESVWRTGHRPGPPPRQVRLRRLRRLVGMALTVVLLIAAGVVVWLRFFDHPPFHVTGVKITRQVRTSCGVDVTGRIETNGSAGTVSYQWVFQPQTQAAQPLDQSVVAGQRAVYVTVAVEGQGHGSATQKVTLDVLGPDTGTAHANVTISC